MSVPVSPGRRTGLATGYLVLESASRASGCRRRTFARCRNLSRVAAGPVPGLAAWAPGRRAGLATGFAWNGSLPVELVAVAVGHLPDVGTLIYGIPAIFNNEL